MKLFFPPKFRYLWAGLATLVAIAMVFLKMTDLLSIDSLPVSLEFLIGLTCLFLFLTMLSREKVEDERLDQLRGQSFAHALFLGVLVAVYCTFFPAQEGAVFQSGAALMFYLQASFLLNFHIRKQQD